MEKMTVGVMGCGRIAGIYLENMTQRFAHVLDVRCCADLLPEAAQARAQEYGVPRVCTPEELIADDEIEMIVNLTVPWAHYEVSMAALEAGKHVYVEKPLAVTREEGRRLLAKAEAKGVRIGGAPDTFLGAGLQTCRKLIDDGWIGAPITAQAFIAMGVGAARYYKRGVGPMFDMGPYYVTAMVALLGPAARVTGSAQTPFAVKAYSDPATAEYGQTFAVETPSIVSGTIDFRDSMAENKAAGTVGSITTTCEIFGYNPRLEIYGTEGILVCNDPNMFGRSVFVRRRNSEGLQEVPYTHGLAENSRGVGAADMAYAVRDDRPHRASGDLMFHVLDIMQGIHEASEQGRHIEMQSSVERPAPLAPGLLPNVLAL